MADCPATGGEHEFEFFPRDPEVGILYAGWWCACGEEAPYDADAEADEWYARQKEDF